MKAGFQKILNFFSPKIIIEIILFALSIGMGLYFQWEIANLIFFLILLRLIIHPVSSRFPAGAAIAFLAITALLLVFKEKDWAENTAIWAYYSMILIVIMAMMENDNNGKLTEK